MRAGLILVGLVVFFAGWAETASAYVGPGAGLTLVGTLWAIIVAVGVPLLAVLVWPVRRLIKKLRGKRRASESDGSGHSD